MHDHHHDHHDHHHHGFSPETGTRFLIAIALNLLFVIAEFALGFRYDSAGLLADAGHNLGDVGGLVISLAAFFMLKKKADQIFTYGFKKVTVLAAFINSLLLTAAVVLIVWESMEKFRSGAAVNGLAVTGTAAAGIAVNGFTVLLLFRGQERDINIKGAYLHMLADTLVSIGVVVSGALILWTGAPWIDPVIGLVIAGIICWSGAGLFRESLHLILDGVPESVNLPHLSAELNEIENVAEIHHLHVWAISTTENALTAHIKLKDLARMEDTRSLLKDFLHHHGISHATLEFESASYPCPEA
ncbi:MAG: cation transporter [Lentisphaerae bacterium]|nr:cation transporter [Lentisphaerota bacterium]